ncbi:Snf7 family like protein, partial [Aduncisulcus paluster]
MGSVCRGTKNNTDETVTTPSFVDQTDFQLLAIETRKDELETQDKRLMKEIASLKAEAKKLGGKDPKTRSIITRYVKREKTRKICIHAIEQLDAIIAKIKEATTLAAHKKVMELGTSELERIYTTAQLDKFQDVLDTAQDKIDDIEEVREMFMESGIDVAGIDDEIDQELADMMVGTIDMPDAPTHAPVLRDSVEYSESSEKLAPTRET